MRIREMLAAIMLAEKIDKPDAEGCEEYDIDFDIVKGVVDAVRFFDVYLQRGDVQEWHSFPKEHVEKLADKIGYLDYF